MTHLRIHLIYLVLIGFLAYQYWTKTEALHHATESIEQLDRLLERNNVLVEKLSILLLNEINKNVKAYPTAIQVSFLNKAKNVVAMSTSLNKWIENQKTEFTSFSGGFDKTDSTVLANRLSTKPSNGFFSNQKIQQIRDSLINYQRFLNDVYAKRDTEHLQKQYTTFKLLGDETYWQKLKNGTVADALMQLTAIQNRILLDKVPYLNYTYNMTSSGEMIFDQFKVAIAPQKAALFEGETFKSDVYLASYSSNLGSYVTISINNHEVKMKDGVAHFETIETTVGKKKVKAIASIRNPLTGQVKTAYGEFEYEVLPKCSRDCK